MACRQLISQIGRAFSRFTRAGVAISCAAVTRELSEGRARERKNGLSMEQ